MSQSRSISDLSYEEARAYKRQQIRSDPRHWIRDQWSHPNDIERDYDFRTNDGTPLRYLVDDQGPLNPDQWADINILLMARGCLKTTSLIGITEWASDSFPSCNTFMTAPQNDAVQNFMSELKDLVRDTRLEDKRERDRFSHQKFEQEMQTGDGETKIAFANVEAKSAWDADEGLRGPHSHLGIIDEFQDVSEKTVAMMLEIVDQAIPDVPYFPTIFIIGTPKLKNSYFHDKWQQSNQRTWDGDANEWVDQSSIGSISADGVDSEFQVKGWKIDQPNCPLHDAGRIQFKREDRTEREFENEVLANFYSPEDDLLSDKHVRATFDDEYGFRNSRFHSPGESTVIITADWGGGSEADAADTVFTAGEVVHHGGGPRDYDCQLLRTRFIDHDVTQTEEEDLLAEWIGRYRPDHVLVDEGHSGTRRESLQDAYPGTVHGVLFGNTQPVEDVKWKRNDAEQKIFATVNKSYVCESFVDAFKDGKFTIPTGSLSFDTNNSNGSKLLNQLTAPYKDYDETVNGRKSLKVLSDRNDDAFDTFVYMWCGIEHVHKGAELTEMWLGNRPGY